MTLPTVKTQPKGDASRKIFLLYGRSKIGKSTWAAKIPGGIFLATDPGLDEIECYRVPQEGVVKTWDELLGYVDEIAKAATFKVIIIDTIDVAWGLCSDATCKKYGVEYYTEGSLGFGKGRAMIASEFQRLILKVKAVGLGLVLISHAQEREEETGGAGTRARWYPSLPRKAGEEIAGLVDAILFADTDAATDTRVIRLKNSSRYQAGCRGWTAPPDKWPLEDYSGLMAAYTAALQKNAGKVPPAKPVPAPVKAAEVHR